MKSEILEILENSPDRWPGYDELVEELEFHYNIETTKDQVENHIKELYHLGLVACEPVMEMDGKFSGSGYFYHEPIEDLPF